MSEIRKVAVKLTNMEHIQASCKKLGLEIVKQQNKVVVKNHGIYTYGRDVELIQQKDGSYILQADASAGELEKLAAKLKHTYAEIAAVGVVVQCKNATVVSRQVDQQKGKIRVRLSYWE